MIWFFLPAAFANVAPVIAARIPGVERIGTPVDRGATWRGKRLLGSHKTWRGFIAGLVVVSGIVWLQSVLAARTGWARSISPVDYGHVNLVLLSVLMTLGALGGDMAESFIKRQLGKYPGQTWTPFDQTDYIIGAIITTLPVVVLSPLQYGLALVVGFTGHVAAGYVGWLFKLKERPI